MNINSAFPSDYLQVSDLNGRSVALTMGRVEIGKVGDDTKPVLQFQGTDKALVLNKTNANTIASVYGHETDNWLGQQIEVYPSETDYQGRRVGCIRVRGPQNAMGVQAQQTPQQNAMAAQAPLGQQGGIAPGNQGQAGFTSQQYANKGMGQDAQTPFDDGLNDEIPY